MNREMTTMFPNGIRALIVDDDAKFIKSSSMLLSLLNFKVVTCGSPASALRFFSRDKNKDVDVVFVNAEKAATCGFDFRGIVESDLCIPVIYFLSRDHVATGDEADVLLRTLCDSTYVLRSPLQGDEVCDLWTVIAWRKCYLEKKAKEADDGRRVVPAAVQAFMAGGGSSSTATVVDEEEREDEDRVHFRVVGAGVRARKRKSGCNTVSAGGSSGTTVTADGDQTAKRKGKMNVTGEDETDDVVSSQQQLVTQQPAAAATTIEAATATTSLWDQPAIGNVAPPPTGLANMTTTVNNEPEFSRGGNQNQQQQKNVCPAPLMFGPFPYQGPLPPVMKLAMSVPLPQYNRTESTSGAPVVGASAAGAGEYGDAAGNSLLQSLDLGTEPADGQDELAAMVAMYIETESNPPVAAAATATAALYSDNSSALMAPAQPQQHNVHGVAANMAETAMDMDAMINTNSYYTNYRAAAAGQEVLNINNGDNFTTYSTSLMGGKMASNQVLDMASNVNELTMAAGAAFFSNADANDDDASFTAPRQDLAAAPPDGDQLASPGAALDAISASLMGSPPGHGVAMDGNPAGLEFQAIFSPDQYDIDNTMFPLEALLGLDDAPVYETGVDYQQQGDDAAGGTAGDAAGAGISLISDDDVNLDIMDGYLFMDCSTEDFFNNGRE